VVAGPMVPSKESVEATRASEDDEKARPSKRPDAIERGHSDDDAAHQERKGRPSHSPGPPAHAPVPAQERRR
jgi:hypothetical protein